MRWVKLPRMARIIYIPGKNPKPPAPQHRAQLWRCLLEGVRRVNPEVAAEMAEKPDCFRLAAWNRDYYKEEVDDRDEQPWVDVLLERTGPTAQDIDEARRWPTRLASLAYSIADLFPSLIPLFADEATRSTIEETNRYFSNLGGSAEIIHAHVIEALEDAFAAGEPVLLIGHSLGSVIAWNTLWLMTHERGVRHKVDLLLTLGSPLGIRFVQERLLGRDHIGATRYPGCLREWVNVAAVGDLTALDGTMADDFQEMVELGLVENISDHFGRIYNYFRSDEGLNPHHSYGYLVNSVVAQLVAEWWYRHHGPSLA